MAFTWYFVKYWIILERTAQFHTLFFLYKNLFYKNVDAEIWPKI